MTEESTRRSPRELVGEWVNVRHHDFDESDGVLAQLDVDPAEDIPEDAHDWTICLSPDSDDAPLDLLWHGNEKYSMLPRTSWSEKVRL